MILEVWQMLELRARFSEVWQLKGLEWIVGKSERSEGLNVGTWRKQVEKKEVVKGKRVRKLLKGRGIGWRRCAKECVCC